MKWLLPIVLIYVWFILPNCGAYTPKVEEQDASGVEQASQADAQEKPEELSLDSRPQEDGISPPETRRDEPTSDAPKLPDYKDERKGSDTQSQDGSSSESSADSGESPQVLDSRQGGEPIVDGGLPQDNHLPPENPTTQDSGSGTCRTWVGVSGSKVQSTILREASGLAASRQNSGVFWSHNDSGGKSEIYAIDTAGKHVATLALPGVSTDDLEDIAIGPGPKPGTNYIYIGDIGDNGRKRASIIVYRVLEPAVKSGQALAELKAQTIDKIELVYPSTIPLPPPLPSFGGFNAESLMLDSKTGDLFVVVKDGSGPEDVYVSRAPHDLKAARKLVKVASPEIGKNGIISTVDSFSAGDISPDGSQIVLRTEKNAFVWHRAVGESIANALSKKPCAIKMLSEPNGEAIAFTTTGLLFTLSEGSQQPLIKYTPQ